MNFNVDDPLADLLSDNSIDDGFFDNPAGGTIKKSRSTGSKAKGKLEDLFGIKEETDTESKRKPSVTSTQKSTKSYAGGHNDGDGVDDDDDDLGFDPKKPKASGTKVNIFDDILNTMDPKRPSTAAPTMSSRRDDGLKPTISRQSTDTTTDNSNLAFSQVRPRTSTGRRSSGNSTIANTDPLGLFTGPSREREVIAAPSALSTPKSKARGTTADWLGLGMETDVGVGNKLVEQPPESPKTPSNFKAQPQTSTTSAFTGETVEILKISNADDAEPTIEIREVNSIQPSGNYNNTSAVTTTNTTAQNMFLLNSMNMESKNAITVLQQQEAQLALATQMKQQERALMEMQRKQESLLQQQERQFQGLLQQQMQRQQQMEEHIKQQQQRINTHIQLLMTQPAMITPLAEMNATVTLNTKSQQETETISQPLIQSTAQQQATALEIVQMEADVKRLELEKLRLEELVENIKTNYEKEIEMIEHSYKKQLDVAQQHLGAVENRLKMELDDVSKFFNRKLESLENEREKLKADYENEVSALKQDHEDELRKIRKSQEDDLEIIKNEHRRMLETVRQAKMLEFATIQENGSYMETLRAASNNLENLSDGLQGLRDEMQQKMETLNREREKKLEAKERRLEDAERRLHINEETAEAERRRLMDLVSTLELQLGTLSKESVEENWLLRQKMSTLEADKIAFEREKEYAREQLARDEKRIADLKELQLAETQRVALELQEERARILVERTKIETEQKLHPQSDLEKQRLEVSATMQVAQDATRQADAERERYHKLQRQLEQQKRELVDKENLLCAKEDELVQELSSFRTAERKSQEAQQRAKLAEQNLQMKITILQQRMRELGEKEATLSHERMLLTQERIAIHNLKRRLTERKCTLCKMSEQNEQITQMLNTQNGDSGGVDSGVMLEIDANPNTTTAAMMTGAVYSNHSAVDVPFRHLVGHSNVVDQLLDDNIADSYQKMKSMTNGRADFWNDLVLDDDSKNLALQNLDYVVQHDNGEHEGVGGAGNYDFFNNTLTRRHL